MGFDGAGIVAVNPGAGKTTQGCNGSPLDALGELTTRLAWLRKLGFDDVDCYWRSLEMALLIGVKP